MGLYPIVPFDASLNGPVQIIQSGLAIAPIVVAPGSATTYQMKQVGPNQDFSMRMWLSDQQEGNPLVGGSWCMARIVELLTIYDSTVSPPPSIRTLAVVPGTYYLHIQNLSNAINHFAIGVFWAPNPDDFGSLDNDVS